jgi:hypothetical protein
LYIAGDDVFVAVEAPNLLKGIKVCNKLMSKIKKDIEDNVETNLSMSIGVEITSNREPIRYYLEMVEKQLDSAKEENAGELKPFLQTKIAIGGLTFFDIDKDKYNKQKSKYSIWQYFLHDIAILKQIRDHETYKEKLATPHFFHTLLSMLTHAENGVQYANNLLYYLLPEYINSSDKTLMYLELKLKAAIIQQVYVSGKIVIDCDTKKRLETYLRLLLLFTDARFKISDDVKQKDDEPKSQQSEEICEYLFNAPINYLYDTALSGKVRDFFLNKQSHEAKRRKRTGSVSYYYQTLHIKKSTFFKLRDTGKINIDCAAVSIGIHNPDPVETPHQEPIKETNGIQKPNYKLKFDPEGFKKAAQTSGAWTPDYVDSLMLFYELNEKFIDFKRLCKEAKSCQKQQASK